MKMHGEIVRKNVYIYFYSFFSRQQYFDNQGMFISLVFSVPILLNCMIMVVSVNVVYCIATCLF
jgi:hypothetical protein